MARRIRTVIPNEDLFNEEEIKQLRAQAKDELLKEKKAKAKKLLLEELKRDALAEVDPNEEVIPYQIALPAYAAEVMIDGVRYVNGQVYDFTQKQLCSVRDIVQNAWNHEEVAFGKRDPNAFIRQRNQSVGPGTAPARIDNHFMRV